jgi:thymidine phosphorylase
LPSSITADLDQGTHVIANGSRAALAALVGKVDNLIVVEITAPTAVIKSRLKERGRENDAQIKSRLTRSVPDFPAGVETITISNDATVSVGVERLISAFEARTAQLVVRKLPIFSGASNRAYLPIDSIIGSPFALAQAPRARLIGKEQGLSVAVDLVEAGWHLAPHEIGLSIETFERLGVAQGANIRIERSTAPESQSLIRQKIKGERLTADDYALIFSDILKNRYAKAEIAPFLFKVIEACDDEELVAIARSRAQIMPRLPWPAPVVVDKHSMGGVPANRITLIVVPIVAAYGMLMPKTSSRAITSASGTADVMEAFCNVALTPDDVRRVVLATGACIAWNGRLNHSPLDDIVNAITLPLGLKSNRWSVASILSKKWSAGSTHVVVDLPYGAGTKLPTRAHADQLAADFMRVGQHIGLTVAPIITEAHEIVGNGLGPALELRDVLMVLRNNPAASSTLRNKALRFAGEILAFDGRIASREDGLRQAEQLLSSGDAYAKFLQIAEHQGDVSEIRPGTARYDMRARAPGKVAGLDQRRLTAVARAAGAPADKAAGIDIAVRLGAEVEAQQLLYTIYASTAADLNLAVEAAKTDSGISLG